MEKEHNRGELRLSSPIAAAVSLIVATALCMTLTPAAWATVEGDQTPASDEEIAAALASGEIKSEDPNADVATMSMKNNSFATYYSGDTRFDTAAMIAKAAYSSADCAVIAADGGWPDALAGASLAGLLDCPILLTSKDGLSQATRDAISQLGVSHVIVLGGPLVVSDRVISDLKGISGMKVERLAGETRQDTQMMVYEYGKKVEGASWSDGMVAITSGYRFPDALSFSPLAFRDHVPIFLVDESGNLSAAQKKALQQDGYSEPVVLGGPLVMSDASWSFAQQLASAAGNKGGAKRIAGDAQYDTSAQIASWLADSKGFSWNGVAFTTGNLPYDALTGSVLQGTQGSVIVVADSASNAGVSSAAANKGSISGIKFFGGELAIPNTLRMSIVHALGQPYSSLPGYKVYLDAGHGQNDMGNGYYAGGATGNGYVEADLTAWLARRVGEILTNDYGIAVYVNDDGGYYKYRNAEAAQLDCYSLVSFHFNSAGGSGSESYRHSYNAAPNAYELQQTVHPRMIEGVGLADRGMKVDEFAVCGGSVPGILLEICFIDNASDMNTYMSNREYVAQKIAQGIAEA